MENIKDIVKELLKQKKTENEIVTIIAAEFGWAAGLEAEDYLVNKEI